MSLALRLPRKMHLCRSSSMSHECHRFRKCYKTLTFSSLLRRCTIPCTCHAKAHLNLQKWREHVVFCAFWLRNVLRATTACTFSTSLNFQKWSEAGVFCTFWLGNVLRATTACTFSWSEPGVFCTFWLRNVLRATTACTFSTSLNFQKVVRSWCVLCILTWKCASRHNGVHFFDISQLPNGPNLVCFVHVLTSKCASRHNGMQFFISHLASWLRIRRFREPTFRPSGATNHWKSAGFCDFPTFSGTWVFFLLTLSPLWSSLFYSSLLSDSSPLCFSSVHTVGSWLLNFLW